MTIRCNVESCRRKIKDLYVCQSTCKCGSVYCYEHIQTTNHKCSVNYFELHKHHLIQLNDQKSQFNKIIKL